MRCKKCRKETPDDSRFCCHCGAPIEKKMYRRPDGLYEKKVTINGKRHVFRGKTEKEILNKIRAFKESEEEGLTFTQAADLWYNDHWETLSPTTQNGYHCAFEELKAYFSDDYIKQLTHKDINEYIKQLNGSYARKTCLTRLSLLNMIFKHAITEDHLTDNPCTYITIPKNHKSKKRTAAKDEDINIIKSGLDITYKGFPVGLLAIFYIYTGVRKGEALALTYGDIDRKKALITINKTVYYNGNLPYIKKCPKTDAGFREIIIPKYLLKLLPTGSKNNYVFSEFPDQPMRKHFYERAFEFWKKQTGLTLTAHQLRHGYATLLYEADIKPKDAQDLMGHANIQTTMDIYTEVSTHQKQATKKRLDEHLK